MIKRAFVLAAGIAAATAFGLTATSAHGSRHDDRNQGLLNVGVSVGSGQGLANVNANVGNLLGAHVGVLQQQSRSRDDSGILNLSIGAPARDQSCNRYCGHRGGVGW